MARRVHRNEASHVDDQFIFGSNFTSSRTPPPKVSSNPSRSSPSSVNINIFIRGQPNRAGITSHDVFNSATSSSSHLISDENNSTRLENLPRRFNSSTVISDINIHRQFSRHFQRYQLEGSDPGELTSISTTVRGRTQTVMSPSLSKSLRTGRVSSPLRSGVSNSSTLLEICKVTPEYQVISEVVPATDVFVENSLLIQNVVTRNLRCNYLQLNHRRDVRTSLDFIHGRCESSMDRLTLLKLCIQFRSFDGILGVEFNNDDCHFIKGCHSSTAVIDISSLCSFRRIQVVLNGALLRQTQRSVDFTIGVYLLTTSLAAAEHAQFEFNQSAFSNLMTYLSPAPSPEVTRNLVDEVYGPDPDISTTSVKISLICPVTRARIQLPCRSTLCRHLSCFDGPTFFKLNIHLPTWVCPHCDCLFTFWDLYTDRVFADILVKNPQVSQVYFLRDGTWSLRAGSTGSPASAGSSDVSVIELSDTESIDLTLEDSVNTEKTRRLSRVPERTLLAARNDVTTRTSLKAISRENGAPSKENSVNTGFLAFPSHVRSHVLVRSMFTSYRISGIKIVAKDSKPGLSEIMVRFFSLAECARALNLRPGARLIDREEYAQASDVSLHHRMTAVVAKLEAFKNNAV